jgi:beta-alanine degradation protein BauB
MTQKNDCASALSRRQAAALLAAFGVTPAARAQDAVAADPRSFRVLIENDRVRVLEYRSRLGFGVCGQGMHHHPAHVTVSLTAAKLKRTTPDGKVTVVDIPAGFVFFAEAETHTVEVVGGAETRTYIVELKGKDWKPSTGWEP